MEKPVIKAVLCGGSNTIMKDGYRPEVLKAVKNFGIGIEVIADVSVGGTTIFSGLYGLLRCDRLADADVLIIEYALNDYPTYGAGRNQDMLQHWSRCYEGVLRYALAVNPRLRIINLIFEERTQAPRRRMSFISAGITHLAGYYGVEVIDIQAELLKSHGPERMATPELYKDRNHYKPDVARFIATKLLARLSSPTPARSDALPPALDPLNFANAKTIGPFDFGPTPERREHKFFPCDFVQMRGRDLTFSIRNGQLLTIMYANRRTDGLLYIRCGDKAHSLYTWKPGIRERFDTLISIVGTEFLYGPALLKNSTADYALSLAPMDNLSKASPIKTPSTEEGDLVDDPTFQLIGLLYTGTLTNLAMSDRQLSAADE